MPGPRYRLVAVDLDGTLIDHRGRVAEEDLAALREARDAGIVVTICTGRALVECREIIERLEQTDPVIVSGGALVACPSTGRTIERFTLPPELVGEVAAFLHARGRPIVLLKDSHAARYDYLAVSPDGPGSLDIASTWWFEHMKASVRHARSIEADEHPHDTIRLGAYQANRPIVELAAELREAFSAVTAQQHFDGVLLPSNPAGGVGMTSVHIVELFDPKACKGQALARLADDLGIPLEETAAIGDQTNDLSMIRAAGLGIAMGNAHPDVHAAARRRTGSVGAGGVATAIRNVLSGEW
ncbi:MAG: HAD hydrolase family protein [Phycisphaerales bacterium]